MAQLVAHRSRSRFRAFIRYDHTARELLENKSDCLENNVRALVNVPMGAARREADDPVGCPTVEL